MVDLMGQYSKIKKGDRNIISSIESVGRKWTNC